MSRSITYCEALCEAQHQAMEEDDRVFVYGIGVPDHKEIFGSTKGLLDKFGNKRCMDTPLAEDSMLGVGLGAALNGLRPINIHIRVDFLLLAMNQLVNMVSSYGYAAGGQLKAPLVIRSVIGRGWGQGCQHSKSIQSLFAHIPGLKVIMPTTPYDAKGMLLRAIRDDNPVVVLEHRWLYWQTGEVPEEPYEVPFGKGQILREGSDITVVATSWMSVEAVHAAQILEKRGVSVEVIDPRSLTPLDTEILTTSVNKTKNCIVADNDWIHAGFGAELAASIYEGCFDSLASPIGRLGFAEIPCPTARHLENEFYCNAEKIVRMIEGKLGLTPTDLSGEQFYAHERRFKGPF